MLRRRYPVGGGHRSGEAATRVVEARHLGRDLRVLMTGEPVRVTEAVLRDDSVVVSLEDLVTVRYLPDDTVEVDE